MTVFGELIGILANTLLVARLKNEAYVVKILVLLIWSTSLVAILGVGYALGGGENQSAANYINGIIAFSGSLSAIGTLCTLYFLIQVRNDWKKPKVSDAALDFKLSLKRWFREADLLCQSVQDYTSNPFTNLDSSKVDFAIENERTSWVELIRFHDKYEFYHGESSELQDKFTILKALRDKLAIKTIRTPDPIMLAQHLPFLSLSSIIISRLKPKLAEAAKDIERTIEIRN